MKGVRGRRWTPEESYKQHLYWKKGFFTCEYCNGLFVYGSDTYHTHLLFQHGMFLDQGRRDRAQDQHQLALFLPGCVHHAVAAGGRDSRDEARRVRPATHPRLPQSHRGDRCLSGRTREQAH